MALAASPAAAAPADSPPRVEGPLLQLGDPTCDEREVRARRTVAADLRACLWWFGYVPVLETDAVRDHGALWFQASVEPRRGWCLRRLSGSLYSSPDVTRMHSFTVGGVEPDAVAVLEVDAEGAALQRAAVSQTLARLPGRIRARPDLDGGSVGFTWRGRTRGGVDAIVAAEISWDASTSAVEVFEFGRLLNPVLTRCA